MKARLYMLIMLTALATQSAFAANFSSFRPEYKTITLPCGTKTVVRIDKNTNPPPRAVAAAPVVKKNSSAKGVR